MDVYSAITVIALVTFIPLPETSSATSLLYPYGSADDTVNVKVDDGSSPLIYLSSSIILFGNISSSLYVNNNGLLSFKSLISTFTPQDLPVVDGNPFLAPFWADIDTVIAGSIYYRQSVEPALLSQATSDIRSYFDLPTFAATLVFIATWDNVAYYGSTDLSMVNTFQSVLCSNGSLTFVMFNYGSILWTTGISSGGNSKGTGGTPALAGVNSGNKIGYYKIPGSLSADIINISSTSNVDLAGRWVFRVDTELPQDASGIIGVLEWPFWTKLVVVAIGFTGGLVFMYVQCKVYIQLWRRLKAYNRVIFVQNCPDTTKKLEIKNHPNNQNTELKDSVSVPVSQTTTNLQSCSNASVPGVMSV